MRDVKGKYIICSFSIGYVIKAIMRTQALYCPGSTAVHWAVQFFCCLCTLLWRQGSYMSWKLSSYNHVKPFLRYLWSKGQPSDSTGKGQTVDPPVDHLDQFFYRFVFKTKSLLSVQKPYVGVPVSPVTHMQAGNPYWLLGKPIFKWIGQKLLSL